MAEPGRHPKYLTAGEKKETDHHHHPPPHHPLSNKFLQNPVFSAGTKEERSQPPNTPGRWLLFSPVQGREARDIFIYLFKFFKIEHKYSDSRRLRGSAPARAARPAPHSQLRDLSARGRGSARGILPLGLDLFFAPSLPLKLRGLGGGECLPPSWHLKDGWMALHCTQMGARRKKGNKGLKIRRIRDGGGRCLLCTRAHTHLHTRARVHTHAVTCPSDPASPPRFFPCSPPPPGSGGSFGGAQPPPASYPIPSHPGPALRAPPPPGAALPTHHSRGAGGGGRSAGPRGRRHLRAERPPAAPAASRHLGLPRTPGRAGAAARQLFPALASRPAAGSRLGSAANFASPASLSSPTPLPLPGSGSGSVSPHPAAARARPPPPFPAPLPAWLPLRAARPAPASAPAPANLRVIISLCDKCCGFPCLRRDIALAFTLASPGELHWVGGTRVGGGGAADPPSPPPLDVSVFFSCLLRDGFLLLLLLLLQKKKKKMKTSGPLFVVAAAVHGLGFPLN